MAKIIGMKLNAIQFMDTRISIYHAISKWGKFVVIVCNLLYIISPFLYNNIIFACFCDFNIASEFRIFSLRFVDFSLQFALFNYSVLVSDNFTYHHLLNMAHLIWNDKEIHYSWKNMKHEWKRIYLVLRSLRFVVMSM